MNPGGAQLYIVQLSAAPLTTYAGGVPGLAPTNPGATGARTLDLNSPASRAYMAYLKAQQEKFLALMGEALGRRVTPIFRYFYAMNGMAARLTSAEAAQVAKLPGVVAVHRDTARPPLDNSPHSRVPQ
ncbi:MAG: protease inhibitor I9 family protein [Gammaproteobacteria bacterium]